MKDDLFVPHATLRLYGGAAFERCMEEFQSAANALHFPSVAHAKLSNILLAHRGRSRFGGGGQAAEEIARATAREYLGPLLDAACARLAFILHQLFNIAVERVHQTGRPNLKAIFALLLVQRQWQRRFVRLLHSMQR